MKYCSKHSSTAKGGAGEVCLEGGDCESGTCGKTGLRGFTNLAGSSSLAEATSQYSNSYKPAKFLDGDDETYWLSGRNPSGPIEAVVGFTGEATYVSVISVKMRYYVPSMKLFLSDGGDRFDEIWTGEASPGETALHLPTPMKASHIKLVFETTSTYIAVYTVEVLRALEYGVCAARSGLVAGHVCAAESDCESKSCLPSPEYPDDGELLYCSGERRLSQAFRPLSHHHAPLGVAADHQPCDWDGQCQSGRCESIFFRDDRYPSRDVALNGVVVPSSVTSPREARYAVDADASASSYWRAKTNNEGEYLMLQMDLYDHEYVNRISCRFRHSSGVSSVRMLTSIDDGVTWDLLFAKHDFAEEIEGVDVEVTPIRATHLKIELLQIWPQNTNDWGIRSLRVFASIPHKICVPKKGMPASGACTSDAQCRRHHFCERKESERYDNRERTLYRFWENSRCRASSALSCDYHIVPRALRKGLLSELYALADASTVTIPDVSSQTPEFSRPVVSEMKSSMWVAASGVPLHSHSLLRLSGGVDVSRAGDYRFVLYSDGLSELSVNGKHLLVTSAAQEVVSERVSLEQGYQSLQLLYTTPPLQNEEQQLTNIALGRKARGSSVFSMSYRAHYAVDGDPESYWDPMKDDPDCSLTIPFEGVYELSMVRMTLLWRNDLHVTISVENQSGELEELYFGLAKKQDPDSARFTYTHKIQPSVSTGLIQVSFDGPADVFEVEVLALVFPNDPDAKGLRPVSDGRPCSQSSVGWDDAQYDCNSALNEVEDRDLYSWRSYKRTAEFEWLSVELEVELPIKEVVVEFRDTDSSYPLPSHVAVMVSLDGSEYEEVQSMPVIEPNTYVSLDEATAAKFVKVMFTLDVSLGKSRMGVRKLVVLEETTAEFICSSFAHVTASGPELSSNPLSSLVDGDTHTTWKSSSNDPVDIIIDLGGTFVLSVVTVTFKHRHVVFDVSLAASEGQYDIVRTESTARRKRVTLRLPAEPVRYMKLSLSETTNDVFEIREVVVTAVEKLYERGFHVQWIDESNERGDITVDSLYHLAGVTSGAPVQRVTHSGQQCVLPFSYQGKTYSDCAHSAVGDFEWCALTQVYEEGRWGRCLSGYIDGSLSHIAINFAEFDLPESVQVDVFDDLSKETLLGSFTGSSLPPTVVSTSPLMTVSISAEHPVTTGGVRGHYESVSLPFHHCSGIAQVTESSGIVEENFYLDNSDCWWLVEPEQETTDFTVESIKVEFLRFDTEKNHDHLEMLDSDGNVLKVWSGTELPTNIEVDLPAITFKFASDASIGGRGFMLRYESIQTENIPSVPIVNFPLRDMAFGRPCFASSTYMGEGEDQSLPVSRHRPGRAVDDHPESLWISDDANDAEWSVDLGVILPIDSVIVVWEPSMEPSFGRLSFDIDGETRVVGDVSPSQGVMDSSNGGGGGVMSTVRLSGEESARFVRVQMQGHGENNEVKRFGIQTVQVLVRGDGQNMTYHTQVVSWGKPATKSCRRKESRDAQYAVDADLSSSWQSCKKNSRLAASDGVAWLQLDLGEIYVIDSYAVDWWALASEYKVEVSPNGGRHDWSGTVVHHVKHNDDHHVAHQLAEPVTGRHIRITSMRVEYKRHGIFEFTVAARIPRPVHRSVSLISTHRDTSSSGERSSRYSPYNAVDGILHSYWATSDGSSSGWITVDLGYDAKLARVEIWWMWPVERYGFDVQVSKEGTEAFEEDWRTIEEGSEQYVQFPTAVDLELASVISSQVRLSMIAARDYSAVGVRELNVYAVGLVEDLGDDANSCEEGEWTEMEGLGLVDADESHVIKTEFASLSDCQARCISETICLSIVYDSEWNVCTRYIFAASEVEASAWVHDGNLNFYELCSFGQ